MVSEPEFFLADDGGTKGPLTAEALRDELRARASEGARVRVAHSGTWLPAFAWEAAGDQSSPPAPPPAPTGSAGSALPQAIAELKPKVREKLLWFVADGDGVRGPISGATLRADLNAGRLAPHTPLSAVSSQEWARADAVFPKLNEGTTAVRARPVATFPCPFCASPIVVGQKKCEACDEPIVGKGSLGRAEIAGVALAVYAALVPLTALLAGKFARGSIAAIAPIHAGAAGSASASASADTNASASAVPSAAPAASPSPARGGHLAGEVAGKMDVAPDAVDALALPHDRLAVARRAVVEVLDTKSGALAFTAADLPGIRALYPVGSAIYGLAQSRIAVIDPESVRALKWIDLGSAPGALAVSASGLALTPLVDQSVAVIDTARHAEIERFHFDERVAAASTDDRADLAALATSDARAPRAGEDAVLLFDPGRFAASQPLRRVYVGEGPVAVAVAPSGASVAAALLSSASIARVDLAAKDRRGAPVVTQKKTCDDPTMVRFVAGESLLLVACRGGRAIALHDASTLAEVGRIDLGGPALGVDVAPDGMQALVVVGAPGASVGVVDLARKSLSRLAITDEVLSAHYSRNGAGAAAFSPRAHRVWVIR